jgi:hypothetical protein
MVCDVDLSEDLEEFLMGVSGCGVDDNNVDDRRGLAPKCFGGVVVDGATFEVGGLFGAKICGFAEEAFFTTKGILVDKFGL